MFPVLTNLDPYVSGFMFEDELEEKKMPASLGGWRQSERALI